MEQKVNNVLDQLSQKHRELEQVVLANRLYNRMHPEQTVMGVLRDEDKPLQPRNLEELLAEHLPFADEAQLKTDAQKLRRGVRSIYDSLEEEITDRWVEAKLNHALEGRSDNEKGRFLVALVKYLRSADLELPVSWRQLENADTFQECHIRELVSIVNTCAEHNAGFLARQEYRIMEHILERLPEEAINAQHNSGVAYAEAYAASLYITAHQDPGQSAPSPWALGAQAATAVEGSHLLAQAALNRNRLMVVMPKLKALFKRLEIFCAVEVLPRLAEYSSLLLLNAMVACAPITIMLLEGVTGITALVLVSAVCMVYTTGEYTRITDNSIVESDISALWNGIKGIIRRIGDWVLGTREQPFTNTNSPVNNTPIQTSHITV